jgi:molybdate transport system substrate-binding protein
LKCLSSGEADIAVQQLSELMVVPGGALVGSIPVEIKNYSINAVAVGSAARDPATARSLLAALTSARAQVVMKDKGMQAP